MDPRGRTILVLLGLALVVDAVPASTLGRWEPMGPPGQRALVYPAAPELPWDGGSRIASIAVDPTDARRVYAATSDGFFASADAGATWSFATPGATNAAQLGTGRIVIDPQTPSTLYVPSCCGLLKSTDAGATWTATSLDVPVFDLVIDPSRPSTLHAVTTSGVLRSVDAGGTWVGDTSAPGSPVSIAIANSSTLYLAAAGGVFRSDDGGQTWAPTAITEAASLVATPSGDPATVYASTSDAFQRSVNGGASWELLTLPRPGAVAALTFDPRLSSFLYASLDPPGLLKSLDGGTQWIDLGPSIRSPLGDDTNPYPPVAVGRDDSSTLYLGTRERGALRSTDAGTTWVPLGVEFSTVSLVAVHPSRPGTVFADNGHGFFRSTDGGRNWTMATIDAGPFGHVGNVAFDAVDPLLVYVAIRDSYQSTPHLVLKSLDGGGSWEPTTLAVPLTGLAVVAGDSQTPSTVYAALSPTGPPTGAGEVFRSIDAGMTWPSVITFPPTGQLTSAVLALITDPAHTGVLFAGTPQGVFRSGDGGAMWAPANAGIEDRAVDALVADAGPTLYAATRIVRYDPRASDYQTVASSGVFRSTDNGSSWVEANRGLGSSTVNGLALDSGTTPLLCAATDAGVSVTRTGGMHWESGGLTLRSLAVAIDQGPPLVVYAGTEMRGLFRIEPTPCVSANECQDGDACTLETCDPSSPRSDLNGCVHDDFLLVACALRHMSDALPCSDMLSRRDLRPIVRRLRQASRLITRARSHGSRRALDRAARILQRADRRILAVFHRSSVPVETCLLGLRGAVGRLRGDVQDLRAG